MQTEREQINVLNRVIVLLAKDQDRLKNEIVSKEKAILEDIKYLQSCSRWRILFALPDMWFAVRQYRKRIRLYNKRVNVIQSFIQAVKQLREELASDSQFNQTFKVD